MDFSEQKTPTLVEDNDQNKDKAYESNSYAEHYFGDTCDDTQHQSNKNNNISDE